MSETPDDYSSSQVAQSQAEVVFLELLQESIGQDATSHVVQQYPFTDVQGNNRYIDFALVGRHCRYAFEVDGEFWHMPGSLAVTTDIFRDSLVRQNSLVHYGWRVFRFSDGQLYTEPNNIKEHIRLFLQDDIVHSSFDGYLPMQQGGSFTLHAHQKEALEYLDKLRSQGKTIALLTHATGSGKTMTAICDAMVVGGRTLYLVHRSGLVNQTLTRFHELWPGVTMEAFDTSYKPDSHIVVGTYQGVGRHLDMFSANEFAYLVADEAHHVPAPSFEKIISYFRPKFTLGMSATPERMDGKPLLDIFQETAPRLDLMEAIEAGLLAPIRCLRVKTNIDMSKLQFNGHDYRIKDLEERIQVPERDHLIVSAYHDHVAGKPGVTFCVNVKHAERVSELFTKHGISSAAVSGRMSVEERERILKQYANGDVMMLCACDLLNEGWDAPHTEVLMMARPTLSKVLYVQQLGRGTRKSPGKECLWVFDFVDNATRYAQSLSVHRILGRSQYHPGGIVAGKIGEDINSTKYLNESMQLGLYIDRVEDIDLFNWKSEAALMMSTVELEAALPVAEGSAFRWIKQGKLIPDHQISAGDVTYNYFRKDRLSEIRTQFKIKKYGSETRKQDFLEFINDMHMTTSYKPAMILSLLKCVDADGSCNISQLVREFTHFYTERISQGLIVEKPSSRISNIANLTEADVYELLMMMPFEKFERRHYLIRGKERGVVQFDQALWSSLTQMDHNLMRMSAMKSLDRYYARLENKQ